MSRGAQKPVSKVILTQSTSRYVQIMPSLLKVAFRGLLPFFSRPLTRGGYTGLRCLKLP
jgi:hypothetical protein